MTHRVDNIALRETKCLEYRSWREKGGTSLAVVASEAVTASVWDGRDMDQAATSARLCSC
jgi:hypothetical protein